MKRLGGRGKRIGDPGGAGRRRRLRRALLAGVLAAGTALVVHALWQPVKADLAQALLEDAWTRAQAGEPQPRPWPWADTWPVARLSIATGVAAAESGEDLDAGGASGSVVGGSGSLSLVVLAGAHGRTLAFGPGHLDGSARPGEEGNVVIAGHRDTHFRVLRDLEPGDELELEAPHGERRRYRVAAARVVRYDDTSALAPTADRLTLVTCWPFDALHPGGPLRYVVTAEAVAPIPATATSPTG